MKRTRKYERVISRDLGKGDSGGKKEGRAALPLPGFLPFYFCVRTFSIWRPRLSMAGPSHPTMSELGTG